jgi:hypothetical protein
VIESGKRNHRTIVSGRKLLIVGRQMSSGAAFRSSPAC